MENCYNMLDTFDYLIFARFLNFMQKYVSPLSRNENLQNQKYCKKCLYCQNFGINCDRISHLSVPNICKWLPLTKHLQFSHFKNQEFSHSVQLNFHPQISIPISIFHLVLMKLITWNCCWVQPSFCVSSIKSDS